MEEEVERVQEPKGMEDMKEQRPSEHSKTEVHVNSQRLWQHAQGLQRSVPEGSLELKEVETSPPSLTQKLSLIDNNLQMKMQFPPR